MNTNYGLTYPSESDYYDINVFNSNFSKLADGIDSSKSGTAQKGNAEIVIASSNSSARIQAAADYICPQGNSSTVFQQAVDEAEYGCSVFVAPGDYTFASTVNISKRLYIHGCNNSSNLAQAAADSVKAVFSVASGGRDSEFRNLKFSDAKGNSSEPIIYVQAENIVFDTCWFEQYHNSTLSVNSIYFQNCAALMRIVNCCFARMESDSAVIINCSKVNAAGIVSGNYCLSNNGMGNMPVKIWVKDNSSSGRIMTGSQNTSVVIGS